MSEYNHNLPVFSLATELMRTSECQCHYHLVRALADAGLLVTNEAQAVLDTLHPKLADYARDYSRGRVFAEAVYAYLASQEGEA